MVAAFLAAVTMTHVPAADAASSRPHHIGRGEQLGSEVLAGGHAVSAHAWGDGRLRYLGHVTWATAYGDDCSGWPWESCTPYAYMSFEVPGGALSGSPGGLLTGTGTLTGWSASIAFQPRTVGHRQEIIFVGTITKPENVG
jgi:hypothetical protein